MVGQLADILVVEDDPGDLELMLHAFKANHLVNPLQIARDGEEALDYVASDAAVSRLGLILLDLKLPRMDGLEVLRHLKSDERTKHVPVVVLTFSSEESDVVESYSHGVNSYIQKPVDFDKFTEIVRSLGRYWLLLNRPLAGIG
jgi:two-component system, response regulator